MNEEKKTAHAQDAVTTLLRDALEFSLGSFDINFLTASVSVLQPPDPICIFVDEPIDHGLRLLQQHSIGCLLVLERDGTLAGIFSERDYIIKGYGKVQNADSAPISALMTPDPITAAPSATLAHVMGLMSEGGFRHVPIVDDERRPLWMISGKLVMDYLVSTYSEALLKFATA